MTNGTIDFFIRMDDKTYQMWLDFKSKIGVSDDSDAFEILIKRYREIIERNPKK